MGIGFSKSPAYKSIEKRLSILANQVNAIEYDLKHTSDADFRKSIKNRNLFKLTKDFQDITTHVEQEDISESMSNRQRQAVQHRLDDLAWKIQGITNYK